jgi:hypothetical protein
VSTDLVVSRLEKAVVLLSEAKSAQDAKAVADLARAAEVYAQRQKLGDEAESWARSVRLQAERLLGDFLAKSPKNEGGRPSKTPRPSRGVSSLKDLGITYDESARAQKLAKMPKEEFEALKAEKPRRVRVREKKTRDETMLEFWRTQRGITEDSVENTLEFDLAPATRQLIWKEVAAIVRLLKKLEA